MNNNIFSLQLFAGEDVTYNIQTTESADLSAEMKVFYSDYIVDIARPKLVHAQFGQKRPVPKNKGKSIEFRKYSKLPKALIPLTEGVTKAGNKLSVSTVTADLYQFGDYIGVSDVLTLTAIDNNLAEAVELLGDQAGRTLDTVIREVINSGTNVIYSGGKEERSLLVGGTGADDDYITVRDVRKAVRKLKAFDAARIDKHYVGIIHPDTEFDLMDDPKWEYPKQYVDTEDLYEGEIGRIAGARFVETSEAKIFHAEDLTADARELTVKGYASGVATVNEAITAEDAAALEGRSVLIGSEILKIASAKAAAAGSATITFEDVSDITDVPAAGDKVYPGEAGAEGRDVYSTLIIGANAYGVTSVEGGGLEHIYKPLGSGEDPLNQRATAGWKAMQGAAILVQENLVRIESCSTFESGAN